MIFLAPGKRSRITPTNARGPTKVSRSIVRAPRHALRMNLTFRADALHWRGSLIVIERVILGAFLVLPLLIVAFLFSDELWQEHVRRTHAPGTRRLDWRHPLRSLLHRQ